MRLAAETVRGYCNTARAFLADRERVPGDLALGALDVAVINDYLLRRSRRGSIASRSAIGPILGKKVCVYHCSPRLRIPSRRVM